jgi:lipoyl synthase
MYVLKTSKILDPLIYTISSIMLGLGETEQEVIETMKNLREVGVDMLTMDYLQPTPRHLPVAEYISPKRFKEFKEIAETMQFIYVASGPLVRSSYKAGEFFME